MLYLHGKEADISRATALKENTPPRPQHERHRPEKTLLYRIIDRHYPGFLFYMEELGKFLPYHVQKEFDEYLKCGRPWKRWAPMSAGAQIPNPARHSVSRAIAGTRPAPSRSVTLIKGFNQASLNLKDTLTLVR